MKHKLSNPFDTIIVGAGIAGLLAATHLQEQEWRVLVLDNGRVPGGRMASRRTEFGLVDHGAQFFTVRHKRFGSFVNEWLTHGRAFEWARGWGAEDGYPRYAGRQGMGQIPAFLAHSLDVRTGIKATAVNATKTGWQILTENGTVYDSRTLLLTPPIPQSLDLLANGSTQLHPDDAAALRRVQYAPSLTGLFQVMGDVHLPHPGAVQALDQPIVWIANNRDKGLTKNNLLTIHSGPVYSVAHFDADEEEALIGHLAAARPYLANGAAIKTIGLKRWRYALPTILHPERTLLARDLPPLAFAGDAFHEPRVEGAALSGLAAADALHQQLTTAGT